VSVSGQCHEVYATVKERATGRIDTICASRVRTSEVYRCHDTSLEIRSLPGSGVRARYFLLKYQGIVHFAAVRSYSSIVDDVISGQETTSFYYCCRIGDFVHCREIGKRKATDWCLSVRPSCLSVFPLTLTWYVASVRFVPSIRSFWTSSTCVTEIGDACDPDKNRL